MASPVSICEKLLTLLLVLYVFDLILDFTKTDCSHSLPVPLYISLKLVLRKLLTSSILSMVNFFFKERGVENLGKGDVTSMTIFSSTLFPFKLETCKVKATLSK